ncbi:hypothetical protein T10_8678 [Trichinella papuae]|uniref:Uncharacterized protein n=1 Tax=Trichinella papuae TaxID=268474 RepID=A0A0V1MWI4_9BILA|nr:hypothetical protein T10_8678 [Trichinella papuae]
MKIRSFMISQSFVITERAELPMPNWSITIHDRKLCNVDGRGNFCLLNVMQISHSRSCLPENVCKFLFHCYAFAYVALVLLVVGVRKKDELSVFAMRIAFMFGMATFDAVRG